jgi:3-oxoacyl-[acyl-carrier-protein] synthase-3
MERLVETSDSWIRKKTGIKERRFAPKDWALSDLCIPAARRALASAKISPKKVDLIIVGAWSHDYYGIPTGNIIKEAIGAKQALAIDLNVICSGTPTTLDVGSKFIRDGTYDTVVVVNGEIFSKYNHTRLTKVIFGDGAGAAVLRPVKDRTGILNTYLRSQLKDATKLAMLGGGSRYPATIDNINKNLFQVQMDGRAIYKFAIKAFADAVKGVLKNTGYSVEDIDFVISHQANINIIKEGLKNAGIPLKKTYTNIDRYANIGGGSVLVALEEAVHKKLIKCGDLVLLVAFGAGLSWGATLMRWAGKEDII